MSHLSSNQPPRPATGTCRPSSQAAVSYGMCPASPRGPRESSLVVLRTVPRPEVQPAFYTPPPVGQGYLAIATGIPLQLQYATASITILGFLVAIAALTFSFWSTGNIIKKCTKAVCGHLTEGARRVVYWRQLRIGAVYQAVRIWTPYPGYEHLGIVCTVDRPPASISVARNVYDGCETQSDDEAQSDYPTASWPKFVGDLVNSRALREDCFGLVWENADLIPPEVPVCGTYVDSADLVTSGVTMDMQVDAYDPARGQFAMSGNCGTLTTAGRSLHAGPIVRYDHHVPRSDLQVNSVSSYTAPAPQPTPSCTRGWARRRGESLRHCGGVYVNIIWGKAYTGNIHQRRPGSLVQLIQERLRTMVDDGFQVFDDGSYPEILFKDPTAPQTLQGARTITKHDAVQAACVDVLSKAHFCIGVPKSAAYPLAPVWSDAVVVMHANMVWTAHPDMTWIGDLDVNLNTQYTNSRRTMIYKHGFCSSDLPWGAPDGPRPVARTPDRLAEWDQKWRNGPITITDDFFKVRSLYPPNYSPQTPHWPDRPDWYPEEAGWEYVLRFDHTIWRALLECRGFLAPGPNFPYKRAVLRICYAVSGIVQPLLSDHQSPLSLPFDVYQRIGIAVDIAITQTELTVPDMSPAALPYTRLICWLLFLRGAYYSYLIRAAGPLGDGIKLGDNPTTARMYMI